MIAGIDANEREIAKKYFMTMRKITHPIRQRMRRAGVYKRPHPKSIL